MTKRSPLFVGISGTLLMMMFFYLILWGTTSDALHPFFFFFEKWYLLTPMFLGFGIQMFLFQKLRSIVHQNSLVMAGVSTGTNVVAMLACCAHHLVEIFPILGFVGIASILTNYQDWFLIAGILMNFFGIFMMQRKIKIHSNADCCQRAQQQADGVFETH